MKKKFTLIMVTCLVFTLLMTAFIACDDNEDNDKKEETEDMITLSVYNACLDLSTPSLVYQQETGKSFTVADYTSIIYNGEEVYGGPIYTGFYFDEQCTKVVHSDTVFNKDTSLYVSVISSGTKTYMIDFVFEGVSYTFYQENKTPLTLDDFVVSAYGKELDRAKLRFFSNESMTDEIEIVGKTFDDLESEESVEFFPTWYVKTVYVELIK